MNMQNVLIGMAALLVSVNVLAGDPIISDVMVHQRWPGAGWLISTMCWNVV